MTDSLYAKYIEEREGTRGIWEPWGFATYRINGEECFLADMFVEKQFRGTNNGRSLLDRLAAIAEEKGCSNITANIFLKDPGANNTIRAAMSVGFNVITSGVNVLLISKDLRG